MYIGRGVVADIDMTYLAIKLPVCVYIGRLIGVDIDMTYLAVKLSV